MKKNEKEERTVTTAAPGAPVEIAKEGYASRRSKGGEKRERTKGGG